MTPSSVKDRTKKRRSSLLTSLKNDARRSLTSVHIPSDIDSTFGVPNHAFEMYKQCRNVKNLYDWQRDCLNQALRDPSNLLVTLPTSGGKSLVADVLILQTLLTRHKDAILILPFVSIVQEKMASLLPLALKLDILVEEYASNKGRIPPLCRKKQNTLYVCTIEKASILINSLIELDKAESSLGLVVIDELHMIGDGSSRGICLEHSIIKLKTAAKTCRLLGLSATLGNTDHILQFMNAKLFDQSFRPVELDEFIKVDDKLWRINTKALCEEDLLADCRDISGNTKCDPDHVLVLVQEVIPQSSCLVFCSTKRNCENLALMLAKELPNTLKENHQEARREFLMNLKIECDGRVCAVLKATIPYGVAYHHSGMTTEERRGIQDAYCQGILNVICCTSTLAAGVNLPARRVIIRSAFVGRELLSRQQYKQMSGRAGRAGLDSKGESIVILHPNSKIKFMQCLLAPISACTSGLNENDAMGIKALILCALALKLIDSFESSVKLVQSSLWGIQCVNSVVVRNQVEKCMGELAHLKLITALDVPPISTTPLGLATHKGGIGLDIACNVYVHLYKPLAQGLVLSTHMHLIYCVIPYDIIEGIHVNFPLLYHMYCSMGTSERRVFELVDITEGNLVRRMANNMTAKNDTTENTLRRLYVCCMLCKLWKCEPVWIVAQYFHVSRGWLQSTLQSAATFAASLARFSQHLPDLWPYQSLLPDFVKRLSHCTVMELIPLMEINGVKQNRARQLYSVGYRSLGDVASSNVLELVSKIEQLSKRNARQMIDSAKMQLREELAVRAEEMAQLLGEKGGQILNLDN